MNFTRRALLALAVVGLSLWPAVASADAVLTITGSSRTLEVVCDPSLGPVLLAPLPGSNEIGPDHAAALIVGMATAEPEIVTGITELRENALDVRIPVANHRDILDGLAAEQPIQISRENVGYLVPAQSTGGSVERLTRSCRLTQPLAADLPPGSFWTHVGSIVKLEAAKNRRKFTFYQISAPMAALGVKPGSLRFEGTMSGSEYFGTAVLYTEKCGTFRYPVSGDVENNEERVVLKGEAPKIGPRCKHLGKRDMTLTFDFIKRH